jgi:hypothetical protein
MKPQYEILKLIGIMAVFMAIFSPLYISYDHAKKQELLSLHGANESFDLLPEDDIMKGPDVRLDYSHLEFSIYKGFHWHFVSHMNFYDKDGNLIKTGVENRLVNCRGLDGEQIDRKIGEKCSSIGDLK